MTIEEWVRTILSGLLIISLVFGVLGWVIKNYLGELKPNSGASLKDQVTRLEKQIDAADLNAVLLEAKIDRMYATMIEYIAMHSKN